MGFIFASIIFLNGMWIAAWKSHEKKVAQESYLGGYQSCLEKHPGAIYPFEGMRTTK